MNVKLNDSLNVPGNGATKWVTAPEDYDYVYNSAQSHLIFDHRLCQKSHAGIFVP